MKTLYTLLILLIPFVGISQTVYVTNTYDSGPGSLRDAVVNATDGTTIRFDESINNQTITLTSNLTSYSNIRIVGNADDQTSSLIKFDNSFFSYGELIIDSIDIHPNSNASFVFFHIYNDFQFKNSFVNNIESTAKIFSIQTDNSDINVNVQNCNFTNIPGRLFYLNAPNINLDLSYSYGNNIEEYFIDAQHLDGTADVKISYSEFNNSNITLTTAIEMLDFSNSTFNNVNFENSYGINVEYYFQGDDITVNIDSVSFSNSELNFFNNYTNVFSNNLNIANSTFNSCSLNFNDGQGNISNSNINNFENFSLGCINIDNSTISSDGSEYNLMNFLSAYNNISCNLNLIKNNFNCDINISGNDELNTITLNECILSGNLSTSEINDLSLISCIIKDNDDFSFNINNGECNNCNTYIKSSYFNNNQGGYYSNNFLIHQVGGYLEIENSTFYDNDKVLYFGYGTEINVIASTFYQNNVCLNLDQWQYINETGSVSFYNSIVGNIEFSLGSSINANGYNIFSNSLNNLSETNFDDVSDLNLTLIEDNSSVTPYLLADYCSIAHDNGDPNFEGSIVNTEVPVNIKDIGSAERTDICNENELSWNCNNDYACVELSDGSGNFQSLEECEANCNPILDSWNCVNDACVDPLDGSGEFSTLNDCEQVCQNISSISENLIDVNIYPNPSSNIFNLEFNSNYETEISVTNVLGEQVYFESVQSVGKFNTQIDLSNYSKGIYNLTIKTSDGISNHKLILQ